MPKWLSKKNRKSHSVYISFGEFKNLARQRNVPQNDQFLVNYYKQLSHERGLSQKGAQHALDGLVTMDVDDDDTNFDYDDDGYYINSNNNNHNNNNNNNNLHRQPTDFENIYILNKFHLYTKDKAIIKHTFLQIVQRQNKHQSLDLHCIGLLIYELIKDFMKYRCLKKPPKFFEIQHLIEEFKTPLSYFNDNRKEFSLAFCQRYLPVIVYKYIEQNQHTVLQTETRKESQMQEMQRITQRMNNINVTIKDYQSEISDIIDDWQLRTTKLRTRTYPEQIDEINNLCNELNGKIGILSDDLSKVENEQLSAERIAEELRIKTLKRYGLYSGNSMNGNMSGIGNLNERGGSVSVKRKTSDTVDSYMASTSIRKPFFMRPLGFDVEIDVDSNDLFVSEITEDSEAFKLKVCRGWRIAMVGKEDRCPIMYKILTDANKQSNDANPLFVTFQVRSLNLQH